MAFALSSTAVNTLRDLDLTRIKRVDKVAQEMTKEEWVARIKRKLALVEEEENADDPQYGAGMF
ncbi:hypothetical protein J6590_008261 [Homalodisca vitripennis]|nr:hypothetical protein J6590_008261 [Homalodisca vitripennis]